MTSIGKMREAPNRRTHHVTEMRQSIFFNAVNMRREKTRMEHASVVFKESVAGKNPVPNQTN